MVAEFALEAQSDRMGNKITASILICVYGHIEIHTIDERSIDTGRQGPKDNWA